MFDCLLGRKFSNKCKRAIKCIVTRIAPIRRKKQATLRFLRKDVAELVAKGLDINAFGRIDALIVETNHASCYDILEQYCKDVKIQLPSLQKQRECSHEAMEAVSTLIFAAARFSDLPELCDLRRLFTERYGSQMESSVNAEFVENIQKKSFPMDKKLRLMQDIAQEFSVTWDCKAFEQKMSNPSTPVVDRPKKGTPVCIGNNKPSHISNGRKEADIDMQNEEIAWKGRFEATPRSIVQKQAQPEARDIHVVSSISNDRPYDHAEKSKKVFASKPENVELFSTNAAVPPYVKPKGRQNGSQKDDQLKEGIARDKSPWAEEGPGLIGLAREVVGADRAANMAPPYTKPKGSKSGTHAEEHDKNQNACDILPRVAEELMDPRGQHRQPVRPVSSNNDRAFNMIPPYVKPKVNNLPAHDRSNDDEHKVRLEDELLGDGRPKPFSVRRRDTKPQVVSEIENTIDDAKLVSRTPGGRRRQGGRQSSATYDDDDYGEEGKIRDRDPKLPVRNEVDRTADCDQNVNRTPSGRRQHGSRRSTGATYDGDCDEDEERIMDRLLVHLSKKGIDGEPGKTRTRTRAAPTELSVNKGKGMEHDSDGKVHPGATKSVHPQRASSFPLEPISPMEVVKGPPRVVSMQPEMLSPNGGRVHPRLPDYDELAAQFIALRKA